MTKKILVGLSTNDLELIILALEMAVNFYVNCNLPFMREKMSKQLESMRSALKELNEKGEENV